MNEQDQERYIGSVLFFKHVILSTAALLILIPLTASIVLGVFNHRLRRERDIWSGEAARLEQVAQELERELEEKSRVPGSQLKGTEDWELLLINDWNPIPQGFTVELTAIKGGQKVDARIKDDLEQMLQDMRNEGLNPLVCSAYRTIEKQEQLFEEEMEKRLQEGWCYSDAFYKVKARLALPGASEHQAGLAVDIVSETHQSLDDAQAETKEAKWLAENCARYGFILRYPAGKMDMTGMEYESWHFRYVGKEAAACIMEQGLTLEEFLGKVPD